MLKVFEINFVDCEGRLISNPSRPDTSNAIPVLDVIVLPPGVTSGSGIHCRALVDTGADHSVAGSSLIDRVGGTLLRSMVNAGVTGEANTTLHDITFVLTATDGHQIAINSDVTATNHAHTAYPVILGRSILRHGALVFDYSARKFEFQVLVEC